MIRNKRLKDMTLEDGPLRSEGVQHATEEERRTSTSSSSANKVVGPKLKGCSAADVPGSERKVQCCKEKYCIETWNVGSMNLGKVDVVKQEMARLCSKSYKVDFSTMWTENSHKYKLDFEGAEELEIKLLTCTGLWRKPESSRKHLLLLH